MNIPSKYSSESAENKWYSYWLKKGYFHSEPDEREPYTIVIPPPNVTGVLHMGHMLNNTIQDILVRRARMLGKNACWVPGTDHASIATEAKVVNKLRGQGIKKSDLSREKFLEHAWEWTHEHGGIILEQLKKLGASCDWDRTCFTMDEKLSSSVIKVFIDLFKKGYIYRGVRMVNWDPQAKTAVSDEEVIYKEEKSKLFYVRYKVEGNTDEWITIATTRPETILGDTAVCINPKDERFSHLRGKNVVVPLVNRTVPIIEDEYVDMEFGTGCLKITPAHDENDYEIGKKHNLEIVDIFNDDGTLNENANLFIGTDRFEARKRIIPELDKEGNLVKIEDYQNKVGYSERTDVVIEPKLSAQWFIKMKELDKPALENVLNDNIKFFPSKYKNLYKHWMDNIKDWCISRQLWWGHRIPVYYFGDDEYVVAESLEEALELAKSKSGLDLVADDLKQDEDVLDTWASSWLWPISVFDGINHPDNEEVNYYYPTNDLVTAPDIIFFWVARMIISGYEYRKDMPFKNVYFTGLVRDSQRRKMSKQLGNSPDPLKLIKKYGADGVRVGMLLCSSAGNDLLFEESLTEQGRNFANKIWNVFRLIKGWETDKDISQPPEAKTAVEWFDSKLNASLEQIEDHFAKFRISDALMNIYTLIRDEFSGWYLEAIKPAYQKPIDQKTYEQSLGFLEKLLKILHPFMPFISEEIYQHIEERNADDSIMISSMPVVDNIDNQIIDTFEETKELISNIRNIRKDKNIPVKSPLTLNITIQKTQSEKPVFYEIVKKLGNIERINKVDKTPENSISFLVKTTEYSIGMEGFVNKEEELDKLNKELEYNKGFLNSVMKKLGNERFVNNAPEQVVATEKKKRDDTELKIKALEKQIEMLKN